MTLPAHLTIIVHVPPAQVAGEMQAGAVWVACSKCEQEAQVPVGTLAWFQACLDAFVAQHAKCRVRGAERKPRAPKSTTPTLPGMQA